MLSFFCNSFESGKKINCFNLLINIKCSEYTSSDCCVAEKSISGICLRYFKSLLIKSFGKSSLTDAVLINTSNGSPSQAQGSIYINVAAVDGDWVQITDGLGNSATFTFRNSPLSSTDVQVTGNSSDDVSNLVNTINGSGVIRVNATNFGYVQLSALDAGTKGNVGISVNASQNVYATGNFTVTGQTPNSSNDGDSIVMPDGTTFTMRESPSSGTDVQIVDDDLNTTCNNLAAAMTSNGYTTSFDGTSTFNITAENYGSQYNGTIQYNPFTGGSSDIFNNGSLSGGQIEFTVNGMSGGTNDTTLNLIYAIESNTAATVLSPNGEIQSLTIGAAGNQNIVYTQFNPEGSMNIGTGINGFSGGADEFSITGMAGGYGPGSSPTFTNLILPTNITIAWSSTTGNVDLLEVVWVPDASVYRCIAFYPGYSS